MIDIKNSRKVKADVMQNTRPGLHESPLSKCNSVNLKTTRIINLTDKPVRSIDSNGAAFEIPSIRKDHYLYELDDMQYIRASKDITVEIPAEYWDCVVIEETYPLAQLVSMYDTNMFGLDKAIDIDTLYMLIANGHRTLTRSTVLTGEDLEMNPEGIYSDVGELMISAMYIVEYTQHPWIAAKMSAPKPDTGAGHVSIELYDPQKQYGDLYTNIADSVIRIQPRRELVGDLSGLRIIKRHSNGVVISDVVYTVAEALSEGGVDGVYCYTSADSALEDKHGSHRIGFDKERQQWILQKEKALQEAMVLGEAKATEAYKERMLALEEQTAAIRKERIDLKNKDTSSKTNALSNTIKFVTVAVTAVVGLLALFGSN